MNAETRERGAQRRASIILRASRHPLAAELAAALTDAGVLNRTRLALLVSGGGDSMAMMLLMAAVRERTDPSLDSLSVLSVDHGLRSDARLECETAMTLAETLGITRREIVRVDVRRDGNLLDAARAARLAATRVFVTQHRCDAAILAHTADDRAESLIMGLAKGLGVSAATRLALRRTMPNLGDLVLVRPLLGATRRALRDFLIDLDIPWHDDPSNSLFERGALRTDPSVARLLEKIAEGASRLSDEVAELRTACDARRIGDVGTSPTEIPRAAFDAIPRAVQRAALMTLGIGAGVGLSSRVLTRALEHSAACDRAPLRLACPGGHELIIDAHSVRISLLGKAVAAETIRDTRDNSCIDLEHHG